MTRFLRLAFVGGILALLASCGAATSGLSAPPGSAAQGDADHGSSDHAGGNAGPIGTLTRSGGIQGKTETLVVGGDGTLRLLDGATSGQVVKTARAPQAQLDSLAAAFVSREWQELDAEYGRQVPDGFAYTISGGNKQVVTYDGAQNPPLLDTVLNQLNGLWQLAQSAP